jgi:hypothetical protein
MYLVDDIPRTIEEEYSSPHANLWKEAVQSEMDSIILMELRKLLNVLMGLNQ